MLTFPHAPPQGPPRLERKHVLPWPNVRLRDTLLDEPRDDGGVIGERLPVAGAVKSGRLHLLLCHGLFLPPLRQVKTLSPGTTMQTAAPQGHQTTADC